MKAQSESGNRPRNKCYLLPVTTSETISNFYEKDSELSNTHRVQTHTEGSKTANSLGHKYPFLF
jgi:hypothetical protein